MGEPTKTYWCAQSGLDLADAAFKRVSRYYERLPQTVMYQRWVKAYRVFYGLQGQDDPFDVSRAEAAGQQGELTALKINHAGSLAQRSVALVSSAVPEFEPVPANTDYKSLAQVDFSKNLLNYYMDTRGVGALLYDVALSSGIFGISWLRPEWDPFAGGPLPQMDPALPSKTRTGDLRFTVVTPLDVVINRYRYDQDHDWFIVREFVNRYTLAARYGVPPPDDANKSPEDNEAARQKATDLYDRIVGFKAKSMPTSPTNRLESERESGDEEERDELVPLFTLYHRKTTALPEGKIAHFLSGDILLFEGNLPYEDVPLIPVSPGQFLRTPWGNTQLHHVLGLQDVFDNLLSAVASNNVSFATQIVMVPDEVDYEVKQVANGLSILSYSGGPNGKKPEGLNLTAPNAEALNFADLLVKHMETIFGISATLRGNPGNNIQSGAFAALVAQQALEYAGAFQYSFQRAVARTGQAIISILQQFASAPIVAEIAGKSKVYELKSFTNADISNIKRVIVKSGNPAARTPQFAMSMADSLLSKGLITADQYITLTRTGELETSIDSKEAAAMNLRRENEMIRAGKKPTAVVTDDHREHIKSHAIELGDPGVRENAATQQAGNAHILEHINMLRTADPALLMLLGQTPLPPAPGGTPTPTGTPPGPQGKPQPGPSPAPAPPQVGGPGKLPSLPNLPSMPNNPNTGQPWTPQDGALQQ